MIHIEPFHEHQAEEVSALIVRTIIEIISKEYPPTFINLLITDFSPTRILEKAKRQFIFVALEDEKIVGTAGLENKGEPENPQYSVVAMFVLPEYHGQGIGKKLIRAVESKAFEMNGQRLTLRAAINATGFYLKMGYNFLEGTEKKDEWGSIMMRKIL